MKPTDRHRSRWVIWTKEAGSARLLLALLSVAVIVCTTSAIASRVHTRQPRDRSPSVNDTAVRAVSKSAVPGASIREAKPQPKLTDSVLLTITPRGFDLKEITVPAVPFFLLVENRSGLSEMSLSLRRDEGSLIRAARVQREELDWAELLDLAPGSYVISEASHLNQVCRLTVTPR